MTTLAEVFIIESLDPDDEGNGRFEGSIISQIVRLHGKAPKYRYVRTREAFEQAVTEFAESKYRYLHISAHGDSKGMCTTNQEDIDFDELSELLIPFMSGRRLFLSACSMVHEDLAKLLIPGSGCYSLVGPTEEIDFSKAAIVWSSIYHLMFSEDRQRMNHKNLQGSLRKVCELFGVEMAYYSKARNLKRGYSRDMLRK